MDSSENLSSLIDQLDDNIDDLENALNPLMQAALSETALNLPLLDRAKLYTLTTYAIESVLFSFVKLNGNDAREHPVFRELARVKQYFEKIKAAEATEQRPSLRVDQAAAGRMIKHDLATNQRKDDSCGHVGKKLSGLGSNSDSVAKRKFDQSALAEPPQGSKVLSDEESSVSPDESSNGEMEESPASKLNAGHPGSAVEPGQDDTVKQDVSLKKKQKTKAKSTKRRLKKRNKR